MHRLTVTAPDRETAIAIWRYLERVFLVKKEDALRVSDQAFSVRTTKQIAGIMRRAIEEKFGA